jgi:hypothetical protein
VSEFVKNEQEKPPRMARKNPKEFGKNYKCGSNLKETM